jgi:hypothetical protein
LALACVLILGNISFCDIRKEVILGIITGIWSTSGLILRPILLLSSVCALPLVLNCDKFGENNDVSQGYKGYQSLDYQSPGYVSLFHGYNLSNSGYHFKHTFSSIRPTGAEIVAFQMFVKLLVLS